MFGRGINTPPRVIWSSLNIYWVPLFCLQESIKVIGGWLFIIFLNSVLSFFKRKTANGLVLNYTLKNTLLQTKTKNRSTIKSPCIDLIQKFSNGEDIVDYSSMKMQYEKRSDILRQIWVENKNWLNNDLHIIGRLFKKILSRLSKTSASTCH